MFDDYCPKELLPAAFESVLEAHRFANWLILYERAREPWPREHSYRIVRWEEPIEEQ